MQSEMEHPKKVMNEDQHLYSLNTRKKEQTTISHTSHSHGTTVIFTGLVVFPVLVMVTKNVQYTEKGHGKHHWWLL